MAKLVINSNAAEAREIQLKPGSNYLGRGFANDFTLPDPSVSGSHCEIVVNGSGAVFVKDLGSTNGTFINRAPIKEGTLLSGQLLMLGGVEMLFDDEVPMTAAPLVSARPTGRIRVNPSAPASRTPPPSEAAV